ncbi:MAG: hypothetical protein Kow0059_20870 [Candidatus Sumerlaeia bacterium]
MSGETSAQPSDALVEALALAARSLSRTLDRPALDREIERRLKSLAQAAGVSHAAFLRVSLPGGVVLAAWDAHLTDDVRLSSVVSDWLRRADAAGVRTAASSRLAWPGGGAREPAAEPWAALIESAELAGLLSLLVLPLPDDEGVFSIIALAGGSPHSAWIAPAATPALVAGVLIDGALRRCEIEDMLGAALRQWHTTIDAIQDMIFLMDLDGCVLRANRALTAYLGRPFDQIIGVNCYKDIYGERGPAELGALDRLRRSRQRQTLEMTRGSHAWRVTLDPLIDAAGALTGTVHIVSDVTEQKRLERQLQSEKRLKAIGQLAAGVAHEVRNPLNAILSLAEALQQDLDSDPDHAVMLDAIRAQVDRLAVLMRDLLELGKPLSPANVQIESLPALCAAAIDLWKAARPPHPQSVRLLLPPEPAVCRVRADGARLQQVFLNILDNASQHSPEQSEILVQILPPEGGMVRVRIVDAGCGVPEENLEKVFEPFMTTRRKGTGLGLSLVKTIVENHHGEVRLWNNAGGPGCTVEVTLPLAGAEEESA